MFSFNICGVVISTISILLSESTGLVAKLSKEVNPLLRFVKTPRILLESDFSPSFSKLSASTVA